MFMNNYDMNECEQTIQITYQSILKEEHRNHDFIVRLCEHASRTNKEMSIGGQIEIQRPFKFIQQTIYGKESATMSLYKKIKDDFRHTVTYEHMQTRQPELDCTFGMTWVNREKGTHFCIVDTMELRALPDMPNTPSRRDRREFSTWA